MEKFILLLNIDRKFQFQQLSKLQPQTVTFRELL